MTGELEGAASRAGSARRARDRVGALWPLPAIAAALGMAAWGWLRWPDPWIDFGRELYVPWRLLSGEALHADLAWLNGPLSPHWNALVFDVFGVGLHTLLAVNAVLATLLGALLLSEVARLGDRLAACVAGLVFVCAFALRQLVGVGNYNYLAPYSHEAVHGLLLGALAIRASVGAGTGPRTTGAGLALGLCFLTKAELFLAAAGGVATAQALAASDAARPLRDALARAVRLAAGAAPPLALSLLLLARRLPFDEALRGTLGSWLHVLDPRLTALRFYREGMGTFDLSASLTGLALATLALAVLVADSVAIGLWLRGSAARLAAGALATLGALAILALGDRIDAVVRPLPLVLVVLAGLAARHWRAIDGAPRARAAARLAWIAWALLLLPKMLLHVRLSNYGFALAMPGTLIALTAWVCWLPRWVDRRGGDASGVRATALALVAAVLAVLVAVSGENFARPAVPVGEGPDRFAAVRHGPALARAIQAVEQHLEAHETLAVVPEGVMVNYLTRRVNPTGHVNLMPPELIAFGEPAIVAAFRERPPDFVLLAHKSTEEYGVPFFGRDYARDLHRLITEGYRPVWQMGAVPLTSDRHGLQLLERRGRSAP